MNIGPVHKKDVQKASAMLEHNVDFACILAFDVPVDREVQLLADREGVRIFNANIIYHLKDSFLNYRFVKFLARSTSIFFLGKSLPIKDGEKTNIWPYSHAKSVFW